MIMFKLLVLMLWYIASGVPKAVQFVTSCNSICFSDIILMIVLYKKQTGTKKVYKFYTPYKKYTLFYC